MVGGGGGHLLGDNQLTFDSYVKIAMRVKSVFVSCRYLKIMSFNRQFHWRFRARGINVNC